MNYGFSGWPLRLKSLSCWVNIEIFRHSEWRHFTYIKNSEYNVRMQFKHLPTLQRSAFKMKSLFTQSWKYFYGILLPFSTKWDRISCSSFIQHKYTNRFKLETDLALKVFVIHDRKNCFPWSGLVFFFRILVYVICSLNRRRLWLYM